ncbi:MFS transporter [Evansella sp. AB-P1]|uniref:MFS transporter n=1 Tax=Evansella sp. AB-P1 TaxID=3037653 RepID=UPI00241D44D3|nr:MFS transporter [Evansella sp. AB-P1]MDG5787203.1 MFS transporter [Evansella sp. AB-P1]
MAFIIILLSMVLYSTALHTTRPIVSLFADMQGASPWLIGLLVSSYALFPMLFALTIGKWTDRFGTRKMAFLGSSGMFLAILIPVVMPSITSLFISQLLLGFCQVCMIVAYQKTVGNLPGNRDKTIMWFTLMGAIGNFFGPLIGGFTFEHFGFQVTFAVAACLIFIGVTCGICLKKAAWKSGEASKTVKNVKFLSSVALLKEKNLRNALISSGLVLYSKDLFVAYFPVYGNSIGLTPTEIGFVLSASAGMAVVIRLSQYWLVNTFGRSIVLTVMLILSGISFIFIPFVSWLPILLILSGLMGAGLGLGQPLSLVYALNFSKKARHGEILGIRLTLNRGSQFFAPFVFGAIGSFAGLIPIFLTSGLFLLIGAFGTKVKEEENVESH